LLLADGPDCLVFIMSDGPYLLSPLLRLGLSSIKSVEEERKRGAAQRQHNQHCPNTQRAPNRREAQTP
ncbi:uncharacterized, partial [Tachysurus ichikawai]